jgi:hypothetical protein
MGLHHEIFSYAFSSFDKSLSPVAGCSGCGTYGWTLSSVSVSTVTLELADF